MSLGLFPCAPSLPTLAVDLQMLDFVQELFVNTAPNLTAWCDTLEGFLNSRKFKLTTRVSYFYNLSYGPDHLFYRIVCVADLAMHCIGMLPWSIPKICACGIISILCAIQ